MGDRRIALGVTALALALCVAAIAVGAGGAIGALTPEASGESALAGGSPAQQGGPVFVRGEPQLDAHVPNPVVRPGQPNEVTVQISNSGELDVGPSEAREIVTTARNVRVEAEAEDDAIEEGIVIQSGETAIGAVAETQPRQFALVVEVPEDVESGTYEIALDIDYAHTRQQASTSTNDVDRSITRTIEIEVDDDAQFRLHNTTTDAQIGDRGTLTTEIENIGNEPARDVSVALESASGGFVFGETTADTARVDRLDPGETAELTYDVAVPDDTAQRQYGLAGVVEYQSPDGYSRVDQSISTGVVPEPKQRFALTDVESELRVGEDGDITGVVTNVGPRDAENVVIQYTDQSQNVVPIETSVSVGSLPAGESASFRLPVDVGGEAEPVQRAVDVAVQYRTADLERRLYEDTELLVDVDPEREQFILEVDDDDRAISAGETEQITVDVTNNLDEPVTDVEARLFADDPLDSGDDEAYVESLEPGETTTIQFELEAESGAVEKTHPISFDFRYDDADGTSQLSDTVRVPIDVSAAEERTSLALWGTVGVVAVIVIVGVAYGLRRRS